MKNTIVFLVGILSAVAVSARTLTSADGSKTIEAEIIDYNPSSGKVVIRNEGASRNTIVNADAFSKNDQEYFKEFLAETAKRKSLAISSEKESVKEDETKGSIYIYEKKKESFTIKIANSSPGNISDLQAKFDIYVNRYDKEGKKTLDVVSGTENISSIDGNYTHEFVSPPVAITVGCSTSSSCPKCKTQAASVKTERVIGIHIQLLDKDGAFLNEYYSSSAVKSALVKKVRNATSGKPDA